MMDLGVCIVATILFFTSNLLNIILRVVYWRTLHFDYEKWKSLDPEYIRQGWEHLAGSRGLAATAGLFGALAWFALCVPILNVAWILSARGKKRVGTNVLIAALAVGGSIAELLARLMMVGISSVGHWVAKDFNLDDWAGDGTGDGTGWRVLEITQLMSHGLILWVDAFEWLALFGILVMIFLSVRAEKDNSPFKASWSVLGLAIAILSLFDFAAEVLRFASWRVFMDISIVISVLNTLVLLPLWLLMLGRQLPGARMAIEVPEVSHVHSNEENFVNDGNLSNEGGLKVSEAQVT